MRSIKLAISMFVVLLDWLRIGMCRVVGARVEPKCVVVYYHAIRDADRKKFSRQMMELRRLSTPVDLENPGVLLAGNRYSVVTFDDGFCSVVDNALPELEALDIPCTIFVPSGSLGHRARWIDASHADGEEVVVEPEVLKHLVGQPNVRVGSHSVSHPNFQRIDREQAVQELSESKRELERVTGCKISSFSFPHGAYTSVSLDLAKRSGYARVCTIEPMESVGLDQFIVGRVRVEPYDWPIEFRLKLKGGYRWMVHASALKRRLRSVLMRSVEVPPAGY